MVLFSLLSDARGVIASCDYKVMLFFTLILHQPIRRACFKLAFYVSYLKKEEEENYLKHITFVNVLK
jgi:hypothetical protein